MSSRLGTSVSISPSDAQQRQHRDGCLRRRANRARRVVPMMELDISTASITFRSHRSETRSIARPCSCAVMMLQPRRCGARVAAARGPAGTRQSSSVSRRGAWSTKKRPSGLVIQPTPASRTPFHMRTIRKDWISTRHTLPKLSTVTTKRPSTGSGKALETMRVASLRARVTESGLCLELLRSITIFRIAAAATPSPECSNFAGNGCCKVAKRNVANSSSAESSKRHSRICASSEENCSAGAFLLQIKAHFSLALPLRQFARSSSVPGDATQAARRRARREELRGALRQRP